MKTHFYCCSVLLMFSHLVNAQSWHSLGSGITGSVNKIVIHEDDLYVGGWFHNAGGNPDADYLARWDGCEWHAVAPGLTGPVYSFEITGDQVYVSGGINGLAGDPDIVHVAVWNGVEWNGLGDFLDYSAFHIEAIGDDIYFAGEFREAGGVPDANLVARWDGSAWHSLGSGPLIEQFVFSEITDMASIGGQLYVVGRFEDMGGVKDADGIARWDGTQWHSVGSGINTSLIASHQLRVVFNGLQIYVSGGFIEPGNPDSEYLLYWNGNPWSQIPTEGSIYTVTHAMTIYQNALYCVRDYEIVRYDLASGHWDSFLSIDTAYTLSVFENDLYVGGLFNEIDEQALSSIARWGDLVKCVSSATNHKPGDAFDLQVYPNPAQDILYYSISEADIQLKKLSVRDASGRLICREDILKAEINISDLPSGLYFIEVTTDRTTAIEKFVKL